MQMSKGTFPPARRARRAASGLVLGAVGLSIGAVCASCVDPKTDYDDYVSRAAAATVPGNYALVDGGDGGGIVTYAADASFTDMSYFAACITSTAPSYKDALLFAVPQVKFTLASGGGGAFSATIEPLKDTATNTSELATGGTTSIPLNGTLDASGKATIMVPGSVNIPANANPITNADATLGNLTLQVIVQSSTEMCANISAQITSSPQATLTPSPCIFRAAPGGVIPSFQQSDFHCP